jgi:hypothetical protein
MIVKWQSPQGIWHWVDCVESVTDYSWRTLSEARDMVKRTDGEDGYLEFKLDAESTIYEDGKGDDSFRYLLLTINGERQHVIMDAVNVFVLSDEGKTVDRLL